MSTIDLPYIVQRWMIEYGGVPLERARFPALKLKLTNVQWHSQRSGPTEGATRSFQMENQSPAQGVGHLKTIKDGRAITTVKIERGVIKGHPKLTTLIMPDAIQSVVGQKAGIEMGSTVTQRIEPSMLQVDADVQLNVQELKYATVENTDHVYEGCFTAIANLSGKVLFENGAEIPVWQIFNDMSQSLQWEVRGHLQVNFEDNQTLSLTS